MDAITISAHKVNGLKNSGALILKKGITPQAINFGGGQENGVRSGTVSVPNAVAMAKAMRISSVQEERADYREWRNMLMEACRPYDKHTNPFTGLWCATYFIHVRSKRINGEVAVNYFQEQGIIFSTSSACSSKNKTVGHVIEAIGLENKFKNGVIRVSFGNTNTKDEIYRIYKSAYRLHGIDREGNVTDEMERNFNSIWRTFLKGKESEPICS